MQTVSQSRSVHHALKAAKNQGLIPTNPADEVEPPKVIRQPMKILNEEQLDAFMDVIRQDAIWYDFFYTELTTGLRRGEICGLMWSEVLHSCPGGDYYLEVWDVFKNGRFLRTEYNLR